jgi:carboxypeptidase family protein/TonB-dependent receptor-like protein
MKLSHKIRLIALFVLLAAVFCTAQVDTARMQGTVTDKTGAAVSGATITVTNIATGRVTNAQADEAGYFTAAGLTPGRYRVEVKQANFKTISQEVTLQTGQIAPFNASLEPGQVSETVEVKSDIPLVESASSNISEVIEGRQITELPLNGRNFTQLATLTPGVSRGAPGNQATGQGNQAETFRFADSGGAALSVNGLRPQANNYILDGIDNNESLVNSIVIFPPAEAIQEFRVDTSVAPAQYGRAGGGVVNTNYKSGTNAIHGSAFEFLRNDNLDAHQFFNPAKDPVTGKSIPNKEFRRNQFGGALGMPIIKNKLFIFGDYSGMRQFQPLETFQATVPTQKMRNGDFSELLTGPNPVTITDPITGAPFAGNIIPADRINPVAQKYLNLFPLPNCTSAVNPNCTPAAHPQQKNFLGTRNVVQTFDDFDIRGDWNVRANDSLFARYSYGEDLETTNSRLGATLGAGFGSGVQDNHPRSIAIGETHIFSPTLINEFRTGWVRTVLGFVPPNQDINLSQQLGVPNGVSNPLLGGGPLIGGFNNQIEYSGDFGPYRVPQNTFQYSDSLSWTHGKHGIKFGAQILRRQVNLFRPNRGKGFFFLFGDGGSGSPTGYEISDLLAGWASNYTIGPPFGMVGTRNWETGYFVQDDWKVTNRLTLNLGVRYDLYTWPSEVQNRQANFDITTGKLVLASDNNASFVKADKNNFAPRVGFAYDLTGNQKTVLRGGYGIFYFLDRGGIDNQLAQNPPFSGFSTFDANNGFRMTMSGLAPAGSTDMRLATAPLPIGSVTNVDVNNPTNVNVFSLLPSNRNSYVQQWNMQIQQSITPNTALTMAYVGTKGTKLAQVYNMNRIPYGADPNNSASKLFPSLGDVTVENTNGSSIYHGLQTQLEHRMSHGVQFSASYTWSHSIDDSNDALDRGPSNIVDFRNLQLERGNSSQDIRHRFVFSSVAEVPFGKGRMFGSNMPAVADAVLGGWQLNPIITLQSGSPFDVTNNDRSRLDLIGNPSPTKGFDPATGQQFFINPAAFANTNNAHPGNVGRNHFYGPSTKIVDMSLLKNFKVTERVNTQFHADFFNLFNTPQWNNPVNNFGDGNFGKVTGVRLASEREIQFGLRVSF